MNAVYKKIKLLFRWEKKVSFISQLIVQIITIISTYDNVQKSKNTKLGKISIILHFPYYPAKQNAP